MALDSAPVIGSMKSIEELRTGVDINGNEVSRTQAVLGMGLGLFGLKGAGKGIGKGLSQISDKADDIADGAKAASKGPKRRVIDIIGDPIDAVKTNYREKYLKGDPALPSGWQVHHSIPQRYQQMFADLGIDINDIQWLRGVDPKVHSKITAEWERFHRRFGGNPSPADVAKFVREIEDKYIDHLRWPGF